MVLSNIYIRFLVKKREFFLTAITPHNKKSDFVIKERELTRQTAASALIRLYLIYLIILQQTDQQLYQLFNFPAIAAI
jgi:hypothetical protein